MPSTFLFVSSSPRGRPCRRDGCKPLPGSSYAAVHHFPGDLPSHRRTPHTASMHTYNYPHSRRLCFYTRTGDAVGGMLWKIVAGGKMTGWQAASSSDTVNGPHVALGPANNLYISDPEQKRVVIFSTNGQPVGQIHPSQPFGKPLGVAVGKEGILFVSDADHCQVLALKLPGALLK